MYLSLGISPLLPASTLSCVMVFFLSKNIKLCISFMLMRRCLLADVQAFHTELILPPYISCSIPIMRSAEVKDLVLVQVYDSCFTHI